MTLDEATAIVKQAYRDNSCWFSDGYFEEKWRITATARNRRSIVGVGEHKSHRIASAMAVMDMKEKMSG